jgi:site-specific DNA-cytosine methylase
MKVLVACEFSGIVRETFKVRGHNAWSCDLLPTEIPGNHIQGDVLEVLKNKRWDLVIAHPPCTYLASSGARWWKDRKKEQLQAMNFFSAIWGYRQWSKMCIENPIGIISTEFGKPSQIIQPWMFGHGETKATCLWLSGLPLLKPTNVVSGREHKVHRMTPSPNRSKDRSRTYPGIASAMAEQWG